MKSNPGEKVKFTNQTKNQFCAENENSFLVLHNGRTIVGVELNTKKTLVNEDITTSKAVSFGKHEGRIQTLLYDEGSGSLFTGDCSGRIKQYKRGSSTHAFSLVKDYGNLGIEIVFSSAQVGGLALFGGSNHSLVAINIHERTLCEGQIKSPFYHTFSLQVCQGVGQKKYLSLGGTKSNYSSSVSDFLDVTEMYNHKKESSKLLKKQMQPTKKEEKVIKSNYKDSL